MEKKELEILRMLLRTNRLKLPDYLGRNSDVVQYITKVINTDEDDIKEKELEQAKASTSVMAKMSSLISGPSGAYGHCTVEKTDKSDYEVEVVYHPPGAHSH